jgi:hypothetical protein
MIMKNITEIKKTLIIKDEYEMPNIWNHIACCLGIHPDEPHIEIVAVKNNHIIPLLENGFDENSKIYKEAKWFVDRLNKLDTMSDDEKRAVCDMAALIAKQELYQ